MDQTAQVVGLVCQHQDLVVWVLGVVGVGSAIGWFKGTLQTKAPWLLHLANVAGLNWDDVAKALVAAMSKKATP